MDSVGANGRPYRDQAKFFISINDRRNFAGTAAVNNRELALAVGKWPARAKFPAQGIVPPPSFSCSFSLL
jgi:hypothetical protein